MLSRSIIFCFSFLGIFALLFVSIPGAFFAHQASWNPTYFRSDEQVVKYFNAHNITVYNSQSSGNITKNQHIPVQGGLPVGTQLDVWWDDDWYYTGIYALGISYETQHWFLGLFQYWTTERLHFTSENGTNRGDFIFPPNLGNDYSTSKNGSFYYARCDSGTQVTMLYTSNYTDIEDGWDAGVLGYMMSYELNASSSSINMFSLLGQILTFQAPTLGISGFFGDLLNAIIAIPITALILFIVYKLITGIAPWFSGGSGD